MFTIFIKLILALGLFTSVVTVAQGAETAGIAGGCDRPNATTAELHQR